jgi:hypothetical protein
MSTENVFTYTPGNILDFRGSHSDFLYDWFLIPIYIFTRLMLDASIRIKIPGYQDDN